MNQGDAEKISVDARTRCRDGMARRNTQTGRVARRGFATPQPTRDRDVRAARGWFSVAQTAHMG